MTMTADKLKELQKKNKIELFGETESDRDNFLSAVIGVTKDKGQLIYSYTKLLHLITRARKSNIGESVAYLETEIFKERLNRAYPLILMNERVPEANDKYRVLRVK